MGIRIFAIFSLLIFPFFASAQNSPADTAWKHLAALPPGTEIRLTYHSGSVVCDFESADEDSIHCLATRRIFFYPVTRNISAPRLSLRQVRLSHKTRSGLVGMLIGGGAGAGIGAGIESSYRSNDDPGLLPFTFGVLGGMLGNAVGRYSDFTSRDVLYRAP